MPIKTLIYESDYFIYYKKTLNLINQTFFMTTTTKGTIFCIHGNSSSARVYHNILNCKSIAYTVITPDLPGHGEHQNKNQTLDSFSIAAYCDFLITEIEKTTGDIILIGNSLGGHLAIEIAPKIKNLKGLVIMGTPPLKKPVNFEEGFMPVPALNTFLTENPDKKEVIETVNSIIKDKSTATLIVEDFTKANPLVRKAVGIDLSEENLSDEYTIFCQLDIPKYIIAGDRDPSINRNYLETLKNDSINICKIFDLDNCGHYPSTEQPEKFNTIIKQLANSVFA